MKYNKMIWTVLKCCQMPARLLESPTLNHDDSHYVVYVKLS